MNEANFAKLSALDVSAHIDKKQTGTTTLSYLSWAWAWDYFKKAYPDAQYKIKEWDGRPYLFDEKTGYMVETSITAGGETHIMWLPVMDGANHAMTDKPYQIVTKYNKPIDVKAANMFDINKTIMRCLVKNMAMFGLGLYIYAGEDLPNETEDFIVAKHTKDDNRSNGNSSGSFSKQINSATTMEELDKIINDIRESVVPLYAKKRKELTK